MMNETVFRGGVPAVGLADNSPVHFPNFGNDYSIPVGAIIGATGGAVLGHLVKKNTVVGAVIGAVFGAAAGWGSGGL